MDKLTEYKTELVENIPEELESGVFYVSKKYEVGVHKCMCGCGETVTTPFDKLLGWTYENNTLEPSVGNFQQPCKSHYFLRKGVVVWC